MEEIELTYLVKELPEGFEKAPRKEMLDIYFPVVSDHPILRIRKSGEKYEITKKEPMAGADASQQFEMTIPLTKEEFDELGQLPGKRVKKTRYFYEEGGVQCEVDVFGGGLRGLVLAEVEFGSMDAKGKFQMPTWCLADVTEEKFIAGGVLAGKSYKDIEEKLHTFEYIKIG
jgi:CYTH domain-containing protein